MALTKVTSGVRTIAASEITTAAIADDAVTLAKLAHGTDGNLITYDASGAPAAVATGTAGHVLTSAGVGAPPVFAAIGPSLGTTFAATSGTSHQFAAPSTGIKEVILTLGDVAMSGSSELLVQLGDAGGNEATGYLCIVTRNAASSNPENASTIGFQLSEVGSSSYDYQGTVNLTPVAADKWVCNASLANTSSNYMTNHCHGFKDLTSELTTVTITTVNGSDTFVAGNINIVWIY